MSKDYSFIIHTNIMRAMKRSNDIMMNSNFTTLDGNILCMVKSFHEQKQSCFMSDDELARNNNCSERTVQRSLKRLADAGLIEIRKVSLDKISKRHLIYKEAAVQKLIDLRF